MPFRKTKPPSIQEIRARHAPKKPRKPPAAKLTPSQKAMLTKQRKEYARRLELVRAEAFNALHEFGGVFDLSIKMQKDRLDDLVRHIDEVSTRAVVDAVQNKVWTHFDKHLHDEVRVILEAPGGEFAHRLKRYEPTLGEYVVAPDPPARPWWKFW